MCIDCVLQQFAVFCQGFDRSYSTASRLYLHIYKLDGEFGKISPNDLQSVVNCLYTMYVNGDFTMVTGGWMEIIEILIISRSSLMTSTRLILVWLESLFVVSYIYHSDVMAGAHAVVLIW